MDYIHLKFWPDPIAASDSWAEQGGEEAKKRACPLPHTWWSSTPTPSPTSRSSFTKSHYLSRTRSPSFLSSLSIFSGNPGNFEPLRDDDSEGPGVMVDGDHEVAYDGKDDFDGWSPSLAQAWRGKHTTPNQARQLKWMRRLTGDLVMTVIIVVVTIITNIIVVVIIITNLTMIITIPLATAWTWWPRTRSAWTEACRTQECRSARTGTIPLNCPRLIFLFYKFRIKDLNIQRTVDRYICPAVGFCCDCLPQRGKIRLAENHTQCY